MKTLIQYINESATLLDIKKYIKDEMQSNYTCALDLLKRSNSTTGLMLGANNYNNENVKNPLKNDGYYLAMLFESSGLSADANIKVIKGIIEENDKLNKNELYNFLHNVLNFKMIRDKRAEKKYDINNFLTNTTKYKNIFNDYCTNFKNLAKYIFCIKTYKKPIQNETIKIGNGELLIQLLFGSSDPNVGDVNTKINGNNVNIEIKSGVASLGSSKKSDNEISDKFLEEVKTILDKENVDVLKEKVKQILSTERTDRLKKIFDTINTRDVSIMQQHEDVYLNTIINLTENIEEKKKIFNSFVSVILSRYELDNKYNIKVCKALKDSYYERRILNGIISKEEIKYFNGLLHIIGYKLQKKFKYLCVTNNTGKFYNIDCNKIENIIQVFNDYTNISNIVDFERSSEKSINKTIDIKLKK